MLSHQSLRQSKRRRRESRARQLLATVASLYGKSLAYDPEHVASHIHLIGVHASLGQTHKAIDHYKKWIASSPESPLAYAFLATAYLKADQVKEAHRVIDVAMKLSSDHPEVLSVAGNVYSRLGQVDDALRYWHQSLESDPRRIGSRYSAAFLLEQQGRWEEAAQEWRQIIAFLRENGFEVEAAWPEKELRRIEEIIARK